jgi:glycosyltransferase involved in cell wall biosynthesis
MNILIVTAYPPVLHRHGGGVRMYHNIRILAEKHNVHVLSFMNIDEHEDILKPIMPFCRSVRGIRRIPDFRPHWLSIKPFMVREFSTPEMHQAVDSMVRDNNIDVLQCEYLQMAQFRRKSVFSILTAHEAQSRNAYEAFETEGEPLQKLKLFYRWMQMLRYEVTEIRKFDRVVTMTPEDANYLSSYAPEVVFRPIPIGIDAAEFEPPQSPSEAPMVALFVGNFLHPPNVEAARFLVNNVAPHVSMLKFVIIGSPIPEGLKPGANVDLRGYVPDTRPFYQGANTIVVTPLFSGSGQRVKLLEAFSMASPVVTTSIGAVGFPIESGVQAVVAETAQEFIAALRRLVQDHPLRKRLGHNARNMILEKFTWQRISKDFFDVVSEAAVSH